MLTRLTNRNILTLQQHMKKIIMEAHLHVIYMSMNSMIDKVIYLNINKSLQQTMQLKEICLSDYLQ